MASSSKKIVKEFYNLRKELLDLTLRNQLLNFKPRSKTLTITNQSPTNIYQTLVLQDYTMTFSPNKKDEVDKSRLRSIWEHPSLDLSIFKDGDRTLRADLSPSELQKRLFYINQQATTMLQEQGYNILYLAVGFLKWQDGHKPKQNNLAPLILIPVEMERKKVGNSFNLTWTGEEIKTNISLKAKLLEDGIELPEFQQTKYVEGVEHYLRKVKDAVVSQKNWEILDNVALGFFSFTKFLMYNDLDPEAFKNSDIRSRYALIESIFDPSKNIYEDTFTEEDIDTKLEYKDMYNVLDADSSQIAAIENVKAGHNLVVEGPPGTGKSQTIVNLIAELLAEDKTVLFVSEKMAALDVVKSRMENVGLGKFVLELHSHKARRKKILKDLERSTNVSKQSNLNIDRTIRKLEKLRKQLDEYSDIIHEPLYEVNLSPFQLYGMKESADDYYSKKGRLLPLVRFSNSEQLTMKDLDDIILSLESLAELRSTITKDNPWNLTNPKSLLPQDLREIEFMINDTLDSLDNFLIEAETVNDVYGIKVPTTLNEYKRSIDAFEILDSRNTELIDPDIIGNFEWISSPRKASELIECVKTYQDTVGIMDKFNDNILLVDLDSLIAEIEKSNQKKFHLFGGSNFKNQLKEIYKKEVPSDKMALRDLNRFKKFVQARSVISNYEEIGERYFGKLWDIKEPFNNYYVVEEWMKNFNHLLVNGTFSERTIEILKNSFFEIDAYKNMQSYLIAGKNFSDTLAKLENKLNPRSQLIFKKDKLDVTFLEWQSQLNIWKGQLSSLHLWSQYLSVKEECKQTNAKIFVDTIEKRKISKDDVKPLVIGNFADSLLNIVFSENPTLSSFIGELHENRIMEFKDLDKKMIQLNRKRLYNKLNNQIPQIFGAANQEEAQVLAGEFTRKSGFLPVRTLLEKAGGTIKRIKPCFMMSPLSIAQYLDPTNEKLQFDVVIFDEASQVKPEDALGAFMRADTAVVMGDTQQLPPTSFFDQMTDADSDEEVATALDMESILHLCKLSFPVKMLKWHYRSRHESLIAVSNEEFYDNNLLVYPSPSHNDPELGLKFYYNDSTFYDRGNTSSNIGEAKLVVDEIFKHFEKYGDTKSLGVGTFSVSQRNAIMEELEVQRKYHPELEPLFNDNRDERFFIKNLETIQGDERDVIIISVGYGFDNEHKMSLNFGPLNQNGGERRLNVLITRAREKCIVFSNFKAHDMHLTNNPPFGVKALKNFLEYAENLNYGRKSLNEVNEDPFEDAVYNFLVENGYTVDKQVGCAGFRVDLAVVDANNPGRYVLGIETDGVMYSSSKVATDRDRLRDQVLLGLGWNIYHLWSTDWYRNRDLARKRLLDAVGSAQVQNVKNEINKELQAYESMKIVPTTTYTPADQNEDSLNDEVDTAIEGSFIKESVEEMESEVENIPESEVEESNPNVEIDEKDISEDNETVQIDDSIKNESEDVISPIISELLYEEESNINPPKTINKDVNVLGDESIVNDTNIPIKDEIKNNISNIKENNIIDEKNNLPEENYEINKSLKFKNKTNMEAKIIENNEVGDIISDEKPKRSLISKLTNNIDKLTAGAKRDESIDIEEAVDNIVTVEKNGLDESNDTESSDYNPEEDSDKTEYSEFNFHKNVPEEVKSSKTKVKFRKRVDIPEIDSENISQEVRDSLDSPDIITVNPDEADVSNIDIITPDEEEPIEELVKNLNTDNNSSITKVDLSQEEDWDNVIIPEHTEDDLIESEELEESFDYSDEGYYEAATDMTNPLRKNTVHREDYVSENKTKGKYSLKALTESLNEMKNELRYIDASLKEIENPTQIDDVYVIDRTEPEIEPEDDDTITPEHVINELEVEDYRSPVDDDLDSIINGINADITKMEKRRAKLNNVLKARDDTKIPKNVNNMDKFIIPYKEASDIKITSPAQLYERPINDVSLDIDDIIKQEGPIHIDDLILRLRESCNLKRAGTKFKSAIKLAIKNSEEQGTVRVDGEFLFYTGSKIIPIRKRVKPNIDFISDDEIKQNILLVLHLQKSLETKKLTKKVAKNFGFKSTSKKTSKRITDNIDLMIAKGEATIKEGRVELL
jgi:superfamily I DNA and/or RNA helicase